MASMHDLSWRNMLHQLWVGSLAVVVQEILCRLDIVIGIIAWVCKVAITSACQVARIVASFLTGEHVIVIH